MDNQNEKVQAEIIYEPVSSGVNFNKFSDSNIVIEAESVDKPAKRPRTKKINDKDEIVVAEQSQYNLPMYQSNVPYIETFTKTNEILDQTIMQVDTLATMVAMDLQEVRSSRTIKGKYQIISQLAASASSLITSKVGIVKEMNKTILDSHNLDLKRIKDIKMDAKNAEVDDNKYIADMYQAYISTDKGPGTGFIPMPSVADLQTLNAGMGQSFQPMVPVDNTTGYSNYLQTMNPQQKAMALESNTAVQHVVVFDQSTGARRFAVMDINTQQEVPGMETRDEMFLNKIKIDVRNKVARDTDLNITYPLIVLGDNNPASTY